MWFFSPPNIESILCAKQWRQTPCSHGFDIAEGDRQKQVNKYKSKIISIVKVKEDYVIVTRWQREIDWWGENFFYKGHLSCYMNDKSPIWRFEQTAFQAEKRVSTKALGQPNFWLLATVGKKVRQDHVKGESTVTVSL